MVPLLDISDLLLLMVCVGHCQDIIVPEVYKQGNDGVGTQCGFRDPRDPNLNLTSTSP